MQKQIIAAAFLLAFSFSAFSQNDEFEQVNRNKLGFSVLPFVTGTFQVQYEYFGSSGNSIWFGPSATYVDSDYQNKFGLGLELQYRIYVYRKETEKHNKNIYFAPYAFYQYYDMKEEDYYYDDYTNDYAPAWRNEEFNVFGGGMLFGLQYVFADKIHLDFYAGGGLRKASKKNYYDYFLEPGYSGFAPKVGIDLGFSF